MEGNAPREAQVVGTTSFSCRRMARRVVPSSSSVCSGSCSDFSFQLCGWLLGRSLERLAWHSRNSRCLSRTWLKPRGEKECSEQCLDLLFGFHMAAELPGAATGAMLRSEQEETVDVFETGSAIALHGFP